MKSKHQEHSVSLHKCNISAIAANTVLSVFRALVDMPKFELRNIRMIA